MFYIYNFILLIIYISVSFETSKAIAEYLCRNTPTMYSFKELQRQDRQDQCCWRGIFFIFLILIIFIIL